MEIRNDIAPMSAAMSLPHILYCDFSNSYDNMSEKVQKTNAMSEKDQTFLKASIIIEKRGCITRWWPIKEAQALVCEGAGERMEKKNQS